jgi:metal-dependent amidase/aminoacylase/carboxypeptidase family protein
VATVPPNEATLLGTVRSLDYEVNKSLPERLERVVASVCQATRARYTFEFIQRYPAMVSDAAFIWSVMRRSSAMPSTASRPYWASRAGRTSPRHSSVERILPSSPSVCRR